MTQRAGSALQTKRVPAVLIGPQRGATSGPRPSSVRQLRNVQPSWPPYEILILLITPIDRSQSLFILIYIVHKKRGKKTTVRGIFYRYCVSTVCCVLMQPTQVKYVRIVTHHTCDGVLFENEHSAVLSFTYIYFYIHDVRRRFRHHGECYLSTARGLFIANLPTPPPP